MWLNRACKHLSSYKIWDAIGICVIRNIKEKSSYKIVVGYGSNGRYLHALSISIIFGILNTQI